MTLARRGEVNWTISCGWAALKVLVRMVAGSACLGGGRGGAGLYVAAAKLLVAEGIAGGGGGGRGSGGATGAGGGFCILESMRKSLIVRWSSLNEAKLVVSSSTRADSLVFPASWAVILVVRGVMVSSLVMESARIPRYVRISGVRPAGGGTGLVAEGGGDGGVLVLARGLFESEQPCAGVVEVTKGPNGGVTAGIRGAVLA